MNSLAKKLTQWFLKEARPLPWREFQDPYPIWVSEVMLQQTTAKAVVPYFEKFMARFPEVTDLSKAGLEDIYQYWAGLGYYSRARNIHKAAQRITELGHFPKTYLDLLELPGFGDYTARAVSSQAFNEAVGVVDGNVIRVLSRLHNKGFEHWKTPGKQALQEIADQLASQAEPRIINQALMELGATLCTPTKPTCFLCPVKGDCQSFKMGSQESLPLKKPKRSSEVWVWEAELFENRGKLAFVLNDYAPFLKKQLILPGKVSHQKKPPTDYDFQHAITHHKIYVRLTRRRSNSQKILKSQIHWISRNQLKAKVPFSIIQKAIDLGLGDR